MLLLAFAILPALAANLPGSVVLAKATPRLASLQIEIWPEFDRPAALVILKGELAQSVALPATVSLRVSAASGGPTAVAYLTGPNSTLLNLKYDRAEAKDYITVRFDLPERLFHIELYEPIVTGKPEREYTYVWPGDLAAEQISVVVQEPAAATNIAVEPSLDGITTGQDGLRYRSAEVGALAAGKQLPVRIRYTKADAKLTSELLQLSSAAAPPAPAGDAGGGPAVWILVLAGASVLLIAAGAAVILLRRQPRKATAAPVGSAGFCAKCGGRTAPDDRFCSKCGAPLG